MVIQRILRHTNVSTTATYYIKTAAEDVQNAMARLENMIPSASKSDTENVQDSFGTLNTDSPAEPASIN